MENVEIIILVPNEWVTGEPDEPHHPEIQSLINLMSRGAWVFADYGAQGQTTTELAFVRGY